jgi:adenine deaminase
MFDYQKAGPVNNFKCSGINIQDIRIIPESAKIRVIEASDGSLFTRERIVDTKMGIPVEPDIESDILKIVVKDRYKDSPPATGLITGFGLKSGAFASSVAHDSHNIICIGTNDADIVNAVNEIARIQGGMAVVSGGKTDSFPLRIAGIMSDEPVDKVANDYQKLSGIVKSYGCRMSAPFMTLSFMALLVIPELKMSDKGLFDGNKFCHVPLFTN